MVRRDLGCRLRGGLVFGAWAGTLIVLVLTDRARLFLRPEFAWLLGLGALIAIGFLLAILRSPVPLPLSRTFILLLPLLHLAASDPASMGQGIFSNRFLGLQTQPAAEVGPAVWPDSEFGTREKVPDEAIARGFAGQEDPDRFSSESGLTILQLLRAPEGHVGATVRLLGLLHRDFGLSRHFGPGRETALYRFVVACCAADALPVTVALHGEVPDLPADQWVEVEGRFELVRFGNATVPLVQAHRISPVDPPADPFLY
jgi:uncharacterized repeat protein (TIGR03943 family)